MAKNNLRLVIGDNIRRIREQMKMNGEEFYTFLFPDKHIQSSSKKNKISHMENGIGITLDDLITITEKCSVSFDSLVHGDNEGIQIDAAFTLRDLCKALAEIFFFFDGNTRRDIQVGQETMAEVLEIPYRAIGGQEHSTIVIHNFNINDPNWRNIVKDPVLVKLQWFLECLHIVKNVDDQAIWQGHEVHHLKEDENLHPTITPFTEIGKRLLKSYLEDVPNETPHDLLDYAIGDLVETSKKMEEIRELRRKEGVSLGENKAEHGKQ